MKQPIGPWRDHFGPKKPPGCGGGKPKHKTNPTRAPAPALGEPVPLSPPHPGPIIDDHIWIYSEKELKEVVEAAGFAIEKLEYSTSQNGRHFNVILRAKQ